MKNTLRMMAITLVISLSIGTAKAADVDEILIFSNNGASFNAGFFNNTVDGAFNDIFRFTIPAGATGTGGASIISGFSFAGPELLFSSFSLKDLTDDNVLVSGSLPNIIANLKFDGADITHDFALLVSGTPLIGTTGGYAGNLSISPIPEPETYAMLLVGLGLIGFAARRRKQNFN